MTSYRIDSGAGTGLGVRDAGPQPTHLPLNSTQREFLLVPARNTARRPMGAIMNIQFAQRLHRGLPEQFRFQDSDHRVPRMAPRPTHAERCGVVLAMRRGARGAVSWMVEPFDGLLGPCQMRRESGVVAVPPSNTVPTTSGFGSVTSESPAICLSR